jgi:hypothetical protein
MAAGDDALWARTWEDCSPIQESFNDWIEFDCYSKPSNLPGVECNMHLDQGFGRCIGLGRAERRCSPQ